MNIVTMGKRIAGIGLGVLIVNSGYLAAFAQPTIFYMGNVLLASGARPGPDGLRRRVGPPLSLGERRIPALGTAGDLPRGRR